MEWKSWLFSARNRLFTRLLNPIFCRRWSRLLLIHLLLWRQIKEENFSCSMAASLASSLNWWVLVAVHLCAARESGSTFSFSLFVVLFCQVTLSCSVEISVHLSNRNHLDNAVVRQIAHYSLDGTEHSQGSILRVTLGWRNVLAPAQCH